MSNRTWQGGAGAQTPAAQVWKGTVTSVTAAQTYTLTLTDEAGGTAAVTYTNGGAETVSTIAAGLVALVNAGTDPRFKAVTASAVSGQVILTADTAGVPFYVAATGSGTWTGTGVTTKNLGPSDWNVPDNWVESVVPVNGDNVVLNVNPSGSSFDVLYGLQTGLSLGTFARQSAYTGRAGGPGLSLSFACTGFDWSGTSGVGYVNIGSSAIAPRVRSTASATAPACGLHLLGSAMTTVAIENGSVNLAATLGYTATATTVLVQGSGRAQLGLGLTLTNLDMASGTVELACAATAVTMDDGTLTTVGAGAISSCNVNGGTATLNSTGTISTLNVNGGTADLTQSELTRTVSACTVAPGGTLLYNPASVTITGKVGVPANIGPVEVTVATA